MIVGLGDYSVHLWRDGVLEDLGLPAGTLYCDLSIFGQVWNPHVNNAGQVTANCYDASTGLGGAFIHQDGLGWSRIGPPELWIQANDLTENGVVVGEAYDVSTSSSTGFIWRDGVFTDLGAVIPVATNPRGQLLSGRYPAQLWTGGWGNRSPWIRSTGTSGCIATSARSRMTAPCSGAAACGTARP